MKLQGKTAFITGAAKRIGRQIALTLADRGMTIVAHYSRSASEVKSLEKEINRLGEDCIPIKCNFSRTSKSSLATRINKLVSETHKKAGDIDVLVNNASIFYPTPLEKVTEKVWDHYFDVNLKAPFFLAQAFGIQMKKKGNGKIINLADWTALRPKERFLPYSATKAGLLSITVGLAKALAPKVQVLGISPGPILPVKGSTKNEQKRVADRTLLKRYGDPKDIANTVRFFCEDTDFITGITIPVDGGASVI